MNRGSWEGVSVYTPTTVTVKGTDPVDPVIGAGAAIEPGPTRLWVHHTGQNALVAAEMTIVSPSLEGGTQTFALARGGAGASAYSFYIELRKGITSLDIVEMAAARTITFITARG